MDSMKMTTASVLAALALGTGCSADDERQVEVATNELGVVALDTHRGEVAGEKVFELSGLDANGSEIASFRMRVGHIEDLPDVPNANFDDHLGTEVTIVVDGHTTRMITRETQTVAVSMNGAPARAQRLLQLPEVSRVLASEVAIEPPAPAQTEPAYAASCAAYAMRTTPIAEDCCMKTSSTRDTMHVNPAAQTRYVTRAGSTFSQNYVCRTATGSSNCSGTACVYGPCGYRAPALWSDGGLYPLPYKDPEVGVDYCGAEFYSTNYNSPALPDITGTCAYNDCVNGVSIVAGGGGSGAAGYWDY
jgi:hypothetical protein